MGNLAIIPARGGSKRIPRKNIKEFLGKPIIAYSIETAIRSELFDEIMVSTDDAEIAEIAIKYGAVVPFFRSQGNANDFASTLNVLKEVEHDYKNKLGQTFDSICCIYPTAPLIKQEHLVEGFNLLKDSDLDAVFPIVAFSYPIWRGVKIVDDKVKLVWPEYQNSRSQDLQSVYHDAGQWYWYNPLRIDKTIFTDNSSSIVLKEEEVQDIDTFSDWTLAEIKFNLMHAR